MARAAANLSLLIQCLQQLILEEPTQDALPASSEVKPRSDSALGSSARSQKTLPLAESELKQLLDLAIEVFVLGDFHQRWDIAKVLPRLGAITIAPLIEILERRRSR